MNRKKYFIKNSALFAVGSIGTKLISFLLVPLYTAVLSTEEYGVVDLIITVGTLLIPIITFNIGEAVMRYLMDKDADYDKIMSVGYVFCALSVLLGILIIPIIQLFPFAREYSIYIGLYCIISGISQVLVCNLKGQEKILQYSISNIMLMVAVVGFNMYFLLALKEGVIGYFKAYILAYLITAIYAAYVGRKRVGKYTFTFDRKFAYSMVVYSVILIPNSFMWWIMNSSDRIMVTAMVGQSANGIYAISYKIPTMLSVVSGIFNQAWFYSAIREDESIDKEEYSNRVYNRMASLLIISIAGLMMIIKPFLRIYVADAYYEAWRYTPYLLIGFGFMTLGTFLSASYTVNKDSKGFLFSGMLGAATNLILNAALIPLMGVSGAALATCVSYFMVYAYRVVHTRKYLTIRVFQKNHLIGFALIIAMATTVFFDNWVGQAMLVLEFCVMLMIQHKIINEIVTCISMKVKLIK